MAITRLGGANAISGVIPTTVGGTGSTASTLPASLINDTSISNITALPAGVGGKVLQVVQDVEQGVITFTGSFADALSLSITPSSTSSKIFLSWNCSMGRGADDYGVLSLFKNGTVVSGAISTVGTGNQINGSNSVSNSGNIAGDQYRVSMASNSYLDSPASTSAITYAIKARCTYGTNIFLNRNESTLNTGYVHRLMSSLTAMEIEG